jgi:uncharacterized membrane protein YjfL (UPF0719 family)
MMINYSVLLVNFGYAAFGAVLTLFFMMLGYKIFDRVTPFNTGEELDDANVAVGLVVAGIFIGVGIAVGLVIGLGLN